MSSFARKLIAVPLVILAAVALIGMPVNARGGIDVSGDWDYVPTIVDQHEVGRHVLLIGTDVGTWTGGLEGTSNEDFLLFAHADGNFNMYSGRMTWEGTVDGREGTMTIVTFGRQVPGGLEPGTGGDWNGWWRITGGTGELQGARGGGTFTGPSLFLDYEGTVSLR